MRVYIAAPYTKSDVGYNVHRAIQAADEIIEKGHIPYIPHLTHFWHIVSPKPWQFWTQMDINWLLVCDCVLRLEGESVGADNEVRVATEAGIPVYYSIGEVP